VVPIVGRENRLPLVQSLEVSASARYESYTDFGDTTKPKYGANWRPFSWVMVSMPVTVPTTLRPALLDS